MLIYIIRHGQTEFNKQGIILGHTNQSLNDEGIKQAKIVAKNIKYLQYAPIFSSDLQRAKETAEIIAKQTKSTITYLENLREKHVGKLEGVKWNEKFDCMTYSELEQVVEEAGGESIDGFHSRVIDCFNEIVQDNMAKHDKIIIVSHGGVIKTIINKILNITEPNNRVLRQDNCSINIIESKKRADQPLFYMIHCINSCFHLLNDETDCSTISSM